MKYPLILAAVAFAPLVAFGQYDYEAATVSPTPARATATPVSSAASPTPSPEEASVDTFMKFDDIEGESDSSKKGNVEAEWKVEEGESSMDDPDITTGDDGSMEGKESGEKAGTEDINIGVGELKADLDLLFSDEGTDEGDPDRPVITGIIREGLEGEDLPVEEVSLNFERIRTTVRQEVRFLGFIPVDTTADVEIDAEGEVKVRFPWWAFLASGKDSDELGSRVLTSLASVIRTSHDTMMNSIRNMK